MFKKIRREEKLEKLNLVPIMDAVFIFIFFLLFSAQFIKLFEIETEAPIVNEVPSNQPLEKEPLNLKLKVYERKLELVKGLDGIVIETFFKREGNYKEKLKEKSMQIRQEFPDDDQIIISPLPNIQYEEIVKLIDAIQVIPKGTLIKVDSKKGPKTLTKIFKQIVLEPLEDV